MSNSFLELAVIVAAALALLSLGGGLYEFLVVDPFWPKRLDLDPAQSRGNIAQTILDSGPHCF